MSGGNTHDESIKRSLIYFTLGGEFGWTKDEIDKLDLELIYDLQTMIEQKYKKMKGH